MLGNKLSKGFEWNIPETCAHKYLCQTIENIFLKFKIPTIAKILDAGCGGGYVLNRLYFNGYKDIWGLDISESGIKVAQNSYNELQNRFSVHNIYDKSLPISFPKAGYDVVLSVEVIEHLYSPSQYLKNISSWLKHDGCLILTTPYHGYLKNLAIALANKFDIHVDSISEGGHIKFFSKSTLYKLLQETSFKPIKFYGSGRLPLLWKSMVIISKKI